MSVPPSVARPALPRDAHTHRIRALLTQLVQDLADSALTNRTEFERLSGSFALALDALLFDGEERVAREREHLHATALTAIDYPIFILDRMGVRYANPAAGHLGLDTVTIEAIHAAGRLHDVGKIGIREAVLNKPGPLTQPEFAHVKDHVRIGLEILSPLHHLGDALLYIRDHHEHWDGGGYPFGRAADDISIGGRILTAADAFDALTSHRAYREPLTAVATLDYLRTQAGRLLEPRIYDALHAVVQNGTVEGIPRVK